MLVTVRKATAVDAPVLARMQWRWRVEESNEPDGGRASFVDFLTSWVIDHLATHLPFLVYVDDRVAGMAWLVLAERIPIPTMYDRRTGEVMSVYVVPELRNSGVGAALLRALLKEAGDRELRHVIVHSGRRAVPFYRRLGFNDDNDWLQWKPSPA